MSASEQPGRVCGDEFGDLFMVGEIGDVQGALGQSGYDLVCPFGVVGPVASLTGDVVSPHLVDAGHPGADGHSGVTAQVRPEHGWNLVVERGELDVGAVMEERCVLSLGVGVAHDHGKGHVSDEAVEFSKWIAGVSVEKLGGLAQRGSASAFVLGGRLPAGGLAKILLVSPLDSSIGRQPRRRGCRPTTTLPAGATFSAPHVSIVLPEYDDAHVRALVEILGFEHTNPYYMRTPR